MKIIEQVNKNGDIESGFDTSLSKKQIFEKIKTFFPNILKEDNLIVGEYKKCKFSILVKNITYLGNPHPLYKKRIQISGLPDFFQKSNLKGLTPLMLGIYTYKDNTLFCDFSIDTYINKKSHNSSAHVYTDDLSTATKEGIFQKTDYFNNTITVFDTDNVETFLKNKFNLFDVDIQDEYRIDTLMFDKKGNYLDAYVSNQQITYVNNNPKDVLEKVFSDFFSSENKEWNGIDCYRKMIENGYRNKFQSEWVGFYLEFEFEEYIKSHNLGLVSYFAQDKNDGGVDLDLYFPTLNSYGDLKAHSSNSKAIQGNDLSTVKKLLNSEEHSNHIYYIVCEHDTFKDKDYDYVVTKFWNDAQNKSDRMSYSTKMKNSVKLKKYFVFDINKDNQSYLTLFRQGVNSNGRLRKPKIMIERDNYDKFLLIEVNF